MKGCSKEDMLEFEKQREQEYIDQLTRIADMVLFVSIFCHIHDFIFLVFLTIIICREVGNCGFELAPQHIKFLVQNFGNRKQSMRLFSLGII